MASIPDIDTKAKPSTEASTSSANDQNEAVKIEMPIETTTEPPKIATEPSAGVQDTQAIPSTSQTNASDCSQATSGQDENDTSTVKDGVKACDDQNYRKYFKMLQFGVPAPAVKMKMTNDGFDPDILK